MRSVSQFSIKTPINSISDVYDGLRLRIKPSNPQLIIRVVCPNPDDCALIKLIYEMVRSPQLDNTPLYIYNWVKLSDRL
ncbi:MAG: hypothetical protein KME55_38545 [Nostoc indistinguendum CM1-VF10]|nr:hypothetical protein [Nostoc indistinguendum CM1-VF10]